jgi:hypothetical protein
MTRIIDLDKWPAPELKSRHDVSLDVPACGNRRYSDHLFMAGRRLEARKKVVSDARRAS